MALFIKTDRDPEGIAVRVDGGFRGSNGLYYLLLHRLPPEYAKPPTFIVQLSADRLEQRGATEETRVYYKAYAIQNFSPGELEFLRNAKPGGSVVPFFNFSYPKVLRILGKRFYKLSDDEIKPLLPAQRYWKLTATDW